jgi:hypothetical protein
MVGRELIGRGGLGGDGCRWHERGAPGDGDSNGIDHLLLGRKRRRLCRFRRRGA